MLLPDAKIRPKNNALFCQYRETPKFMDHSMSLPLLRGCEHLPTRRNMRFTPTRLPWNLLLLGVMSIGLWGCDQSSSGGTHSGGTIGSGEALAVWCRGAPAVAPAAPPAREGAHLLAAPQALAEPLRPVAQKALAEFRELGARQLWARVAKVQVAAAPAARVVAP
jgi:hypothetical protein